VPVWSAGNAPITPLVGPVQENRTFSPGENPEAVATYVSPILTWQVDSVSCGTGDAGFSKTKAAAAVAATRAVMVPNTSHGRRGRWAAGDAEPVGGDDVGRPGGGLGLGAACGVGGGGGMTISGRV